MVEIRLHNTKTRKKEPFAPIDRQNVRMYVCGPTVYDRAHIGNARPVIVFDVLYRLLRHVYGPDHVTYVRNFTDVDDKINAEAQRRKGLGDPRTLEELIRERTEETIGWYHADMDALGALRPNIEPRATDFIGKQVPGTGHYDGMIGMISTLIERKHAYVVRDQSNNPPKEYVIFDSNSKTGEHALFDVDSYENYGALSGRSVEDMIAGARVEVAPYKRNPADFVLWKPSEDDLPGWESPWGRGRPGWHIECSAMSLELLGKSFDIHGGGIDLQFPHHENEIAQSCCALADEDDPTGKDKFARVWMHNEMLQVEGKKMSKSLGNFFTVRDLLDEGWPGEVIRFVYLQTHYSKPMDWTEEKANGAIKILREWAIGARSSSAETIDAIFLDELCDNLNSSEAIHRLYELAESKSWGALLASIELLGFDLKAIEKANWAKEFSVTAPDGSTLLEGVDFQPTVGFVGWGHFEQSSVDLVLALARKWLHHRREKDWTAADQLRERALSFGLELRANRSANGVNGATVHVRGGVPSTEVQELLK